MLKKLRRINELVARFAADGASTMACFYIFFAWSILPLLAGSTRELVFYISGGILQLILLPLINVTTKRESQRLDARAQQDHAAIMEELSLHRQEMQRLNEIERLLKDALHQS